MTSSILTILAPVFVSGLLAILAGWFAGRRAASERSRAFIEEWSRARQDQVAAETVALIQDIATKLARAAHIMWWLSWRAANEPEVVNDEAIGKFQWEFHELIPQIVGAHAALRAMSPAAADEVDPPVARLHELCAEISATTILARKGDCRGLAGQYEDAAGYKRELNAALKGASGRVLARYGESGILAAPQESSE